MRKGKSIVGKDVLTLADARKIDTVKDIVIGHDGAAIVALLVDEGGLLSSSRVVPIENVQSFGRDAIVISDSRAVMDATRVPRVNVILDRDEKLVGKKVFTEEGDEQGTISDLYFEESSGRIVGFEVSGGLLGNVARGNSYLPVEEITRSGPDVIYIRPESAEGLESQVGGVQGALQAAGDKLGEAGASAKSRVSQARPEDSLVGRRSARDVEDDEGHIIVAANQRIRPEHVAEARDRNKLDALSAAAAEGEAQQTAESVGDGLAAAGDRAGSLWDQFTRKIAEMTDATGKRVDEEQTKRRLAEIEDAVGRPVTKVILDRSDNVILNLGEIITHEAVQKAHDANALDSLLDSAYKGEVSFSKEEMMAEQEGAATIEKASGDAPIVGELEQRLARAEQERRDQREEQRAAAEADRERRAAEREERSAERAAKAEQREQEAAAARESTSRA